MKKKVEMPPRPKAEGPPIIFDLRERVPGMSDSALGTLRDNARRLSQSGDTRQRTSAELLMPAIEAELALREAKALAERAERKPARKAAAAKGARAAR